MGEDKERMLRGDWYLDEPDLVEDRRRCWRTLDWFNATGADDDDERRRLGWERPAAVTVGPNAWLGAGVIVCPGVTIGENAVVGAGSVVIRDVADHTRTVGNPARPVRQL